MVFFLQLLSSCSILPELDEQVLLQNSSYAHTHTHIISFDIHFLMPACPLRQNSLRQVSNSWMLFPSPTHPFPSKVIPPHPTPHQRTENVSLRRLEIHELPIFSVHQFFSQGFRWLRSVTEDTCLQGTRSGPELEALWCFHSHTHTLVHIANYSKTHRQ